ncbi:hypothetical protein KY316_03920, partial [Candidatus Woesearchaeota archaeon]|nr:hypothetical protein [Candidatus Woesearchaeota archaeon]
MAEENPLDYMKRLLEFGQKREAAEAEIDSLEDEMAQIERVIKNNQRDLESKKKKKKSLEASIQKVLQPEQAELRKAAIGSVKNLFMYKAVCLDPDKAEDLYKALIEKYSMLNSFLRPNSWLIIEESGVDIKQTSNSRVSLDNEVAYEYLAVGRTMDDPIGITRNLTDDGEVYMQIRLRFKPE